MHFRVVSHRFLVSVEIELSGLLLDLGRGLDGCGLWLHAVSALSSVLGSLLEVLLTLRLIEIFSSEAFAIVVAVFFSGLLLVATATIIVVASLLLVVALVA